MFQPRLVNPLMTSEVDRKSIKDLRKEEASRPIVGNILSCGFRKLANLEMFFFFIPFSMNNCSRSLCENCQFLLSLTFQFLHFLPEQSVQKELTERRGSCWSFIFMIIWFLYIIRSIFFRDEDPVFAKFRIQGSVPRTIRDI